MNDWKLFLSGLFIGSALGILGGAMASKVDTKNQWQREAVIRGHAHYVTTEKGLPEWQWKEAAEQ